MQAPTTTTKFDFPMDLPERGLALVCVRATFDHCERRWTDIDSPVLVDCPEGGNDLLDPADLDQSSRLMVEAEVEANLAHCTPDEAESARLIDEARGDHDFHCQHDDA